MKNFFLFLSSVKSITQWFFFLETTIKNIHLNIMNKFINSGAIHSHTSHPSVFAMMCNTTDFVSSAKANLNRPVGKKQTGERKLVTWLLFHPHFTHNATHYYVFRNININISLVLSNRDLHFVQGRMEEMVEWACSSQSSTVLLAGFYEKTNKPGERKMWPPRQR